MNADEIKKWDRHVIYGWKAQRDVDPIIMDRAEGIYIWDIQGKRYLDFCAGLLCVNVGHGHKHVLEAMKRQMEKLTYVAPMFGTEPKAKLAKMISEVTPGDLDYVFFTNAGAEAVENAIKASRMFTGRNKIYSRWRSYHGATSGAITLTGDPRRWAAEPGLPGVVKFFGPYCYRCPLGYESEETCNLQCLEMLKTQMMLDGPKTIAAIFVEPIVGTNGIIIPPYNYLKGIRQLCDENGIVMVADEVMAGFGRSGKWFGIDHYDVVPDIMVVAKGLTSGYVQLGAMIWNKKIYEHFYEHPFVGGLTYSGHALACATGVANIEVYHQEKLIENSYTRGEYLHQKLVELRAKHRSVGDVRSKGLWACIELTADQNTKAPLAGFADAIRNVSNGLTSRLYEAGLYLFTKWDLLFIAPPLTITDAQIDEAMAIVDQALEYTDSLIS
ncbi:aminotransferase class III-fold pyridoxal phosphate-dependent enzyme [candidate division CSSED10-310 bacterium]|uniref:Aminotransferase class III-fold pyridoxal phosphate-dependent enzyme n=1 Tax=candidate division CSSED10-310 bacterium TaxID=2855610 RepID=A0ABV6YTV1_UNCC1